MGLSRWEIIAGLALPLVAADAQAWLLGEDAVGPWLTWSFAAFGIVALLCATRRWSSALRRSLVCGTNFGCAAGWLASAADHAWRGDFFVLLIGFGPLVLLACASSTANFHRALTSIRQNGGLHRGWIATAALLVFFVPVAMQFVEARWIEATLTRLSWDDIPGTVVALRALNRYPLRLGRFTFDVCDRVVIGGSLWNSDEQLRREVVELLGPNPDACIGRDPHG